MMTLSEQRLATLNLTLAFMVIGLMNSGWALWLGIVLAAFWSARFASLMCEPLAPETKEGSHT